MLLPLPTNIRVLMTNGFKRECVRLMLAFMVTISLAASTLAYTLILRTGQRLDISNKFTVTEDYLTYEAGKDIRVSIPTISINIAATEEANGEPSGSFLSRLDNLDKSSQSNSQIPYKANRTITDQDIEPIKRQRELQEKEMEKRLKALNIPQSTFGEVERKRLQETQKQREAEELKMENYWRSRAQALRTEIKVLNAKISNLREKIARTSETYAYPYLILNGYHAPWAPVTHAQIPSLSSVGWPRYNHHYPFTVGVPLIIPNPNYSSERSILISRLHELEIEREGLLKSWELLEEEARRAGALPGWLRE
jgi:hypothetical protein